MLLPQLSFPLCLINCSLKIKEPDASLPLLPLLLLFCSFCPVQDSVKDLAGTIMTTNFLYLSFHFEIREEQSPGHQVCVGHWVMRWPKAQSDT